MQRLTCATAAALLSAFCAEGTTAGSAARCFVIGAHLGGLGHVHADRAPGTEKRESNAFHPTKTIKMNHVTTHERHLMTTLQLTVYRGARTQEPWPRHLQPCLCPPSWRLSNSSVHTLNSCLGTYVISALGEEKALHTVTMKRDFTQYQAKKVARIFKPLQQD